MTVGPLPPAVYWRRRVLVLGAALLAIFLIAQACMASASTGDRPDAGSTPGPTSSPASSTAPSPPPATSSQSTSPDPEPSGGEAASAPPDPATCTDAEVKVIAAATKTTFPVGEVVTFSIQIDHAADRTCQRDVGGDQRELYLVRETGAGHVWSSQDCADPSGSEVIELTDGWSREHTIGFAGEDCGDPARELEPGTYQLRARLGTAQSEPVTITLT